MATKMNKKNNIKTSWNLKLLYDGIDDPKIKRDTDAFVRACEAFEKKYKKGKPYLKNDAALLSALRDTEKIESMPSPFLYLYFLTDLDGKNDAARALEARLSDVCKKAGNKIIFFGLDIAKIEKSRQKKLLADKKFATYRYFLEKIFESAKHQLTEPEEKILTLVGSQSRSMWIDGNQKLLQSISVDWKGKKISLGDAINKIRDLSVRDGRELHKKCVTLLKNSSHFAEAELNAVYYDKKIKDELRHYEKPYSSTASSHQVKESTIDTLIAAVSGSFSIAHEFFALKKKLLGVKELEYPDRAKSIGTTRKEVSFEHGYELIKSAFTNADPEYRKIIEAFAQNGQIDVFPKLGKTSGAYSVSKTASHPGFVLLNWSDSPDAVMTFGHEMGHAVHGVRSADSQPVFYEGHSTATAEVASTFFENFAFEELLKEMSDEEKAIALHDRIQDDIQTIYRQVACFNFELALHEAVRKDGYVPKEKIAVLMNEHMKSYLGPDFKLNDEDGYFFVYWSHIRNFFYVYSYAFGQLISKALYARVKKDPSYMKKVDEFLCAGESDTPEHIFKKIGIDVTKPEFWKEGLASIKADIARLKKLTRKKK